MKASSFIPAVLVLCLLITPLEADKISVATSQRIVHFFDTLGQKTDWYFALELGDDEQKAVELADKLENSKASSIGTGQMDKSQMLTLLDINTFRSRFDVARRCISLQYNLPPLTLGAVDTFCNVNLIDGNLLPHPLAGTISAENMGIKLEDKAYAYLESLKGKASFDSRVLSVDGATSDMSDPDVKVIGGSSCGNVFDFLNSLCLTQKHSHFLYMAYMIPQPQPEQRVDLYIGK